MEENPYSKIVGIMRKSAADTAPAGYRIGTVINTDPLRVDIDGAIQAQGDLVTLVSSPAVKVDVEPAGVGDHGTHKHTAKTSDDNPKYKVGDKLMLFPAEDEQRYIIMGRLEGL